MKIIRKIRILDLCCRRQSCTDPSHPDILAQIILSSSRFLRVSNAPGNFGKSAGIIFPPGNLLEIYKVCWKFSGLVCEFACLSLIAVLVFQSVSVQSIWQ